MGRKITPILRKTKVKQEALLITGQTNQRCIAFKIVAPPRIELGSKV